MTKKDFSEIKELLQSSSKKIVLIPHKNPDGDAMGSSLALYKFLTNNNHKATVLAPTSYPKFLHWLPNNNKVVVFNKRNQQTIQILKDAEILFFMDFNDLNRIEDMKEYIDESDAVKIMIDHHQQPSDFADYTFVDPKVCAASQMTYHFLENLDVANEIDYDIATCLYTGILTDTGSFRFSTTTSTTHRIVADLIDKGAVNHKIHNNVLDGNTMSRMKLMGVALNNLIVMPESKTAFITMSRKELKENNFEKGDTEGFVNMALSVEGVSVAALFTEDLDHDFVKISLRSKGVFSVNQLSRDNFNGGGHINAAGGKVDDSLQNVVELFKKVVSENKEDIIKSEL
ncbi:MAG: bifunctional oligoribonuclease/PAP phosphatase NrnA [Ichthyobacteriaceae bacterium]|nr:bifunctional oligoribonuclease/PAP phosphatase NrnA [Ichthyobacteriaceae bacterium]